MSESHLFFSTSKNFSLISDMISSKNGKFSSRLYCFQTIFSFSLCQVFFEVISLIFPGVKIQ